ncbi:MAG: transcriptional repressor [Actinobacteria bacterium]|nr:transcriptional repressor [Actinomycetota bacterium]
MAAATEAAGLAERLRSAGFRLTRQRRAVLEAVGNAPTCLNAAELLAEARRYYPSVSLATVYRTLEVLDGIGGAERVHALGSRASFVPCPPKDHHHVVCRSCGRVADFEGCMVTAMAASVTEQTGFTVDSHFLELAGMCRECRQRNDSACIGDGADRGCAGNATYATRKRDDFS